MTKATANLVYIGAALYLNVDSCEVDAVLSEHDLVLTDENANECMNILKREFADSWQATVHKAQQDEMAAFRQVPPAR